MADLDSKASPRLYKHHQRFARYARVRHSKQLYEFLTVQAARLSTTQANTLRPLVRLD